MHTVESRYQLQHGWMHKVFSQHPRHNRETTVTRGYMCYCVLSAHGKINSERLKTNPPTASEPFRSRRIAKSGGSDSAIQALKQKMSVRSAKFILHEYPASPECKIYFARVSKSVRARRTQELAKSCCCDQGPCRFVRCWLFRLDSGSNGLSFGQVVLRMPCRFVRNDRC